MTVLDQRTTTLRERLEGLIGWDGLDELVIVPWLLRLFG